MPLTLQLIPGEFAVCRLAPTGPIPAWAGSPVFSSITRTADELSIIGPANSVPSDVRSESGWRLLKMVGPFDFGTIRILTSVTEPLARAGISLLAVGTFNIDYVLIKAVQLDQTFAALEKAGHHVHRN